MLKFNANLTLLYTEHAFLDRFAAAAADGFKGVEYLGPYNEAKEAIAERLLASGLEQVLFNLPAGNWDAGERGLACLPDRREEFRRGVDLAIDYAKTLNCRKINCLAGIAPPGVAFEPVEATLVENLRFAAKRLADAGIKLMLEAVNRRDIPGCFVSTTNHIERILEQVGSDNLFIQYDFYHLQVMQGDLIPTFQRLQNRIGHIQVADNPGRHEPGTGEINYAFVFEALQRLGYDGWVGCEYRPLGKTSDGLGWLKALRDR